MTGFKNHIVGRVDLGQNHNDMNLKLKIKSRKFIPERNESLATKYIVYLFPRPEPSSF